MPDTSSIVTARWKIEANLRRYHNGATLGLTLHGDVDLEPGQPLTDVIPIMTELLKEQMEVENCPQLLGLRLTLGAVNLNTEH